MLISLLLELPCLNVGLFLAVAFIEYTVTTLKWCNAREYRP